MKKDIPFILVVVGCILMTISALIYRIEYKSTLKERNQLWEENISLRLNPDTLYLTDTVTQVIQSLCESEMEEGFKYMAQNPEAGEELREINNQQLTEE